MPLLLKLISLLYFSPDSTNEFKSHHSRKVILNLGWKLHMHLLLKFLSVSLFTSIQIPRNAWWRKSSIFGCWCKWWREEYFIFSQSTLEVTWKIWVAIIFWMVSISVFFSSFILLNISFIYFVTVLVRGWLHFRIIRSDARSLLCVQFMHDSWMSQLDWFSEHMIK